MPAIVKAQLCDGCQACEWSCPAHAVTVMDRMAIVDPDECTDCGTCTQVCPRAAIQLCTENASGQVTERICNPIFDAIDTPAQPWLGAFDLMSEAMLEPPTAGPPV